MKKLFKSANPERFKWLAVTLLGFCVMWVNYQLQSLPTEIIPFTLDFISGLGELEIS